MNRRIIRENYFSHKKAQKAHKKYFSARPLWFYLCAFCAFLWLSHHVDRTDAGARDSEYRFAAVLVGLHAAGGGAQEFFARFAVIRETGDAEADAQTDHRARAHGEELILNCIAHSFADRNRHLSRRHRHDRDKLISSITSQNIHLSQLATHDTRHARQQTIANRMTVLIIHDLEVVDVHTDDGQRLPVHSLALGQTLFEHHVETARIGQLGEWIDERTVARLLVSQSVVESA